LRAAQHFHVGQVVHRVTLEDRVFLHHVVVNQGNWLRCEHGEVGVTVAADVEAREYTAGRRFDVQRWGLARQDADVLAAGQQDVQLFVLDHGHGNRHFADIFSAALCGYGHYFQLASWGLGYFLGQGGHRHGRADCQKTLMHLGQFHHVLSLWVM
jgi:hypothetical protein